MIEVMGFKMQVSFWSIGAIICTFLQAIGAWLQNKLIWRGESGEAVSVGLFGYLVCYFASFAIYANHTKEIPMALNSLLIVIYISIFVGLSLYKGFTKKEVMLLSGSVIIIPAMAFCPEKDLIYMITLFGILIFLAVQVWEIATVGKTGTVNPAFNIIAMITAVFWYPYARSIDNVPLMFFNPIGFLLNGVIVGFWYRAYLKNKSNPEYL